MAPPRSSRRANPHQRKQLSHLVLESLKYLSEHATWSTRAVVNLIRSEPRAAELATLCGCTNDCLLGRRVGAVLRRGAGFGILKQHRGRYRFADGRHPRRRSCKHGGSRSSGSSRSRSR